MSAEEAEGFAKPGSTLEGRVAQLLRVSGFKVTRNIFLEDHEVDVFAESEEGKRIIVECKEYYTQLIPRDLILIFATKVRDINPDEAWFVTINDFEPSARELCKRYGIHSINGYELEELEEKVAEGPITLGPVPPEGRLLRLLNRQRSILRKKKGDAEKLRHVAKEIDELRRSSLDLPPFLFPMYPSALQRRHIFLRELEATQKITKGVVKEVVVNINSVPPKVRGFRVKERSQVRISVVIAALSFLFAAITLLYPEYDVYFKQFYRDFLLIAFLLIFVGIASLVFYNRLVWKYYRTSLRPVSGATFTDGGLLILEEKAIESQEGDVDSNRLFNAQAILADDTRLGSSKDFIIEKATWNILGVKIETAPEISKNTGFKETIVPTQNMRLYLDPMNQINLRINAVYVLSETFLKEEMM